MKMQFRSWLIPPRFEDDESRTALAREVYMVAWVTISITLIYFLLLLILVPSLGPRIVFAVPLLAVQLLVLSSVRRGQVKLGAMAVVGSLWLVLAISTVLSGGVRSVSYSGNLLVILISAVLLDRRVAVSFTVLSLVEGMVLAGAEAMNALPPLSTTAGSALLAQTAYLAIELVFLQFAAFNTKAAFRQVHHELAERHRVEAALQESHALLQTVLDTIPVRVFWKDRELHYLGCNRSFAYAAGLNAPAEIVGKDDYQLGWRKQADRRRNDDWQVIASGQSQLNGEELQTAPDNGRIWLRTNRVPLQDAQGVITGVLGTYEDISEQKQTEETLRKTQFAVDQARDAIHWVNAEGRLVYVNDSMCKALGYTREELLSMTVFDIDPVFPRATWLEYWQKLTMLGSSQFEATYQAKDAHTFPVEVAVTVMQFDDEIIHCDYVRDITQRKQAEETLRLAEEKYRSIVENAVEGIFQSTPEGHFISVNPAMARMYGYATPDEMIRSIENITQQVYADPEQRLHLQQQLEEEGVVQGFEGQDRRKDGSTFWTSMNVRIVRDTQGKTLYYEGMLEDITARKQAEETLQMFQYTVDRASDGVQWLNREAGFEYVNDQACRSLGYTREELLRLHLWDIDPIYPKERWDKNWEQYQAGRLGGDENVESLYRRKDGSVFPVEVASNHLWFGDRELHVAVVRDITERKQTEEALRRSEMFLDSIIEYSPISMWISDNEGTLIRLNQACHDLLHIKSHEVIGKYNLFQDNIVKKQGVLPFIRQVFEKGETVRFTLSYDSSQLEHFNFVETTSVILDVTISPVIDASGRVTNAIVQQIDITERKRAEEQLRESEERFRKIFEESRIGIVLVDSQQAYLAVNKAFCSMVGYSQEELLSLSYRAISHPADIEENVRNAQALWQGEIPYYKTEKRYIHKDGKIVWTFLETTLIRDGQGKPIYYLSVIEDITERKQTEDALREKTAELNQYFTNALDLFCIADTDGYFRRLNAEWEAALGYPLQELEGTQFLDYVHPDDQEATVAAVSRLDAQEEILNFVNRYRSKDGTYRWIEWRSSAVGKTIYAAARDITERKRAEAERENLIKELEARNAELERFTYTVSHDLKSPLVTITGFLGYLEKDARLGDAAKIRNDILRIAQAAERMQRLLTELLELSRIGRMMNSPEAVPFEMIVRDAVELVRGHLETRGVAVDIAPDLPVVYGDRVRLIEVVQNLLDNACKFMGDQPEPQIVIGQQGADREENLIVFVRDNGIGIEPPYHDQVFGLFNKLDTQTEGTGIGLALVKRIVEVHGGRIWVESAGAGQGSIFYFTLPRPAVDSSSSMEFS